MHWDLQIIEYAPRIPASYCGVDETDEEAINLAVQKGAKLTICKYGHVYDFTGRSAGCYQRRKVIYRYAEIGVFTITMDDAKDYLYAKSTKRRILNWHDFDVRVYI